MNIDRKDNGCYIQIHVSSIYWRNMMALGILVLTSVLGSGKDANNIVFVGCMDYYYMVNETCFRCPENCTICVSDTNCTLCRKGFFGPVCENKCDFSCTGTCHKEYGHCTYGCPDGTYPADDNSCQPCSSMCSLCASTSHCIVCNSTHVLDAGKCSLTNGNDTSSTNHSMTIIPFVGAVFVVAGIIAVILFNRKRCSTNASIKREQTLEVASLTDVVQLDLLSQILDQNDNTTGTLFINIQSTERLKVEERVDDRDATKTEDDISDIVPDVEGKTGTDTYPEADSSDLDHESKHEIKSTNTQRGCSAQHKSMFSVTTPAPHKNPNRHRTRDSNPYPKPKYKDKSGKDHTQCRTQDSIWKEEYTPISPEECEVKCSAVFDKAYYDQVERFTS